MLVCGWTHASGLQVAPISLQLGAAQRADGLWLSNTGDAPLHAQVRVFHWDQEDGKDNLQASRGLIVSPPMLELAAGARQLVRVIRSGPPPTDRENAYRVLIDELPVARPVADAAPAPEGRRGLQFVLRYSVPVFVEPPGAPAVPELTGRLVRSGEHIELELANRGAGHAQLGNLAYVDAGGRRTELAAGLVGYVLADRTMRFALDPGGAWLAEGGHVQSRINGEAVERIVASVVAPPAN